MPHGKIVCKSCDKLMAQCRCVEGHKQVSYSLCEDCKGKNKPSPLGERISGACARGYCSKRSEKANKIVDPDLIADMTTEILKEIAGE